MLSSSYLAKRSAGSSESGFTLIELLVVMAAGMVIVIALLTVIDVTLRQTTRTFSRVDATQHGRVAIEVIANELHSACVADGLAPIQGGSTGTSLTFISQYGSAGSGATAASPTPVEHLLTYNAAAGTLTDATYTATGGSAPSWTFSSTPSRTATLLSDVALQTGGIPMFQYFAYVIPTTSGGSAYTDLAGNDYEMIEDGINTVPGTSIAPAAAPLSTPLSASNAPSAAEVLIRLVAKPSGGSGENTNLSDAGDSVTDQVLLRLTPPANHVGAGSTFGPCD